MKTAFKNPISNAIREYREDMKSNKRNWLTMGRGSNNEYLLIQFKDDDNYIIVDATYFEENGDKFPSIRANEIKYISRYFGDGIEIITTKDMVIDIPYNGDDEVFINEYIDGEIAIRTKVSKTELYKVADTIDSIIEVCKGILN